MPHYPSPPHPTSPSPQAFALNLIEETHKQWQSLISGETDSKIAIKAVTGGASKISAEEAAAIVHAAPAAAAPAAVDADGRRKQR